MDMGCNELLPIIRDTPVLFGLFASDPMINLYDYLQKIRENGFSGVVNYPTLSLIDGKFGEALSEEGNTYEKEVEAIKLAHFLDLFTIAFVVDAEQARKMSEHADGVIVGSAIVRMVAKYGKDCVGPVCEYIREMKAAIL